MASINKRYEKIFGDGKLTRAELNYKSFDGKRDITLPVQFNPTEYSISRVNNCKIKNGKGKNPDPKRIHMREAGLAKLNVKLVLDIATYLSKSEATKGLEAYLNDDKELTLICQELALATKINPDKHTQNGVTFSWGATVFYGYVTALSINYQMFNLDGMPVRASIDLEMKGEELDILTEIGANPLQSPDRTKFRRVNQKEELWMIADAEYNDASYWKEIARENGILNPRKIDHTRRLKVPAL